MAEEMGGNQKKVKEIIERVTGEEAKIIAVPSELIHFMGKMNKRGKTQKAVFLSQLIYWSDRGKRKDEFIYKTQKEWKEETGLSESQVSSYTNELEEWSFIKTKLKKANGSPTVHYKVNMDYFLESFKEFLSNRNWQNRRNQSVESEDSLTENTTQNNSDIPHSLNNSNFEEEENKSNKNPNVNKIILDFYGRVNSNKTIAGFNLEEKILLPVNFTPNLEKQFRAIMELPDKSPSYVTKKFIDFYGNQTTRKTLFEWNNKWWDWIYKEIPPYYSDTNSLEQERNDIYKRVLNFFLNFPTMLNLAVIHRDKFHQKFDRDIYEQAIDEILELLVNNGDFKRVGDYFFISTKYRDSSEYKAAVDIELRRLGLTFDVN